MKPTTITAAKWGLLIGLANLIWLYVAYYLGLHTNGIVVFQFFMLGWFLLTLTGYILALRAVKRADPTVGYWRGLGAGTIAAVVSAAVAVLMQIGYHTVIHPAWPDFMAQQTREHLATQGLPAEQLDQIVEQARVSFGLQNYTISSALTALITGIVLTAIIMIFLRRKPSPEQH